MTTLDLGCLPNLEKVVLRGSFSKLEKIIFNKSSHLQELEGLEDTANFPSLKHIGITDTPNLAELKKSALKAGYEGIEFD